MIEKDFEKTVEEFKRTTTSLKSQCRQGRAINWIHTLLGGIVVGIGINIIAQGQYGLGVTDSTNTFVDICTEEFEAKHGRKVVD